jgi:sorbitol-specific phosphotransferase system component IIC
LIKGRIASYAALPVDGERIRCNPFKFSAFVSDDDRPAQAAAVVVLHPDKRIEARGVILFSGA